MSKPENVQMKKAPALTRSYSSFLSVDAFYSKPSNATIAKQAALTVTVLFAIEYGVRLVLEEFQHMQPLLEKETNRLILARHIGTDWFCCVIVALLGISNFTTICPGFLDAARGKQGAMPRGGYESRMFTYQPASFRICMFFFCYQVKNMYDTILWQDGLIFVAHHVRLSSGRSMVEFYADCMALSLSEFAFSHTLFSLCSCSVNVLFGGLRYHRPLCGTLSRAILFWHFGIIHGISLSAGEF